MFDFNSGEFSCNKTCLILITQSSSTKPSLISGLFCGSSVVEDQSAVPKDSRLMLARFNEQLQPLYDLLREVEGIKLAPSVIEPEPMTLDQIRGLGKPNEQGNTEVWSGEATRSSGFAVEETRVDITIGDHDATDSAAPKKERPVWMTGKHPKIYFYSTFLSSFNLYRKYCCWIERC